MSQDHRAKYNNRRWINTHVEYEWDGEKYVETVVDGYWYEGPIASAHNDGAVEQRDWAFYDDDAAPASSTF